MLDYNLYYINLLKGDVKMEPKIDTIRERVTKEIRHLILMGKFKPGKKNVRNYYCSRIKC